MAPDQKKCWSNQKKTMHNQCASEHEVLLFFWTRTGSQRTPKLLHIISSVTQLQKGPQGKKKLQSSPAKCKKDPRSRSDRDWVQELHLQIPASLRSTAAATPPGSLPQGLTQQERSCLSQEEAEGVVPYTIGSEQVDGAGHRRPRERSSHGTLRQAEENTSTRACQTPPRCPEGRKRQSFRRQWERIASQQSRGEDHVLPLSLTATADRERQEHEWTTPPHTSSLPPRSARRSEAERHPCTMMTHKYRGSQQSSREVLPKFIDSTQGEPKNIYISLNRWVVNSAAPENSLAHSGYQ
jgi:hypothetical protein